MIKRDKKGRFIKGGNSYWKGKKLSMEHKEKLSKSHIGLLVGEKNPKWKGGVKSETYRKIQRIRNSSKYRINRDIVFKRDNYSCSWCGLKIGDKYSNGSLVRLELDHIIPMRENIKLAYNLDNCRILCRECHKLTNTYAGKYSSNHKFERLNFFGRVFIKDLNTGETILRSDNIITQDGKISVARMVAGPLSGLVVPSIQQMHIGNGGVDVTNGIAIAPSPTQNSLENTILEDSSIDTISVNTAPEVREVKFTSTFDASDASVDFGSFKANVASEVGLITSENLLFAYKTFDRLTFDPAVPSILQVTWTIFI